MDFTGERPTLGQEVEGSRLRYKSILPFVTNKKVIDYGCGIGLGSHMLSFYAEKVIGFDKNLEAIQEASNNFKKLNLSFINVVTVMHLTSVDIIAMVEVLEHIEKEDFLRLLDSYSKIVPEIACTTPEGITMPYQPRTISERRGYHVWHYTIDELENIFKRFYTFVEIYGHLFDPRIKKYTSYVIYGSNKIKWDDNWLKDAKYNPNENIIDEFYKNAEPSDFFKKAHEEYLKSSENQPDFNVEQAKLWALLGHQIPGAEIF
jgi:2-polyprenyl-3-methyl-5-hydroxy-6-metoxy-1,4-benzoquinol methylase